MSRSGYSDEYGDGDNYSYALWVGAVASAVRGKRGQRLLRDLLAALDAMTHKRLITGYLECEGEHCALGVVGEARGVDLTAFNTLDEYDCMDMALAPALDIADALLREVVYVNDDVGLLSETPEARWKRVRAWVCERITDVSPAITAPVIPGAVRP